MKLGTIFPSKYLKSDEITQDTSVTIARIAIEKLKDDEGTSEDRPILYFFRMDKGLVLNKTNANRISDIHGDETDLWVGKQIILTVESVDAFGKQVWAIRVKPERKMPAAAPVAAPMAAPAQPESEESKKERFLNLFGVLGLYATPVFRRNGLVLDSEVYRDISASKVAAMKKKQVDALLDEVRLEAGAAMPAEEQDISF